MNDGAGRSPDRPDRPGAVEHARDQVESEFTAILRRLWASAPEVLAVAFIDSEGECVDYCSSLDPFDAKVTAAHLRVVMADVERRFAALGAGEASHLVLEADRRDLLVRRVSEEYALVAVTEPGGATRPAVLEELEQVVVAVRQEGRIGRPSWDPVRGGLEVQLRAAVGWPYAPLAIVERGRRLQVTEVLGRWLETLPGGRRAVECFRVRTSSGEESTLAYDPEQDAWVRR